MEARRIAMLSYTKKVQRTCFLMFRYKNQKVSIHGIVKLLRSKAIHRWTKFWNKCWISGLAINHLQKSHKLIRKSTSQQKISAVKDKDRVPKLCLTSKTCPTKKSSNIFGNFLRRTTLLNKRSKSFAYLKNRRKTWESLIGH